MKQFKQTLLVITFFLGCLSSHFSYSYPIEEQLERVLAEQEESKRLQSLCTLYWDWHLAENPDEATFLGYPGRHDRWPDLSEATIKCRYHSNSLLIKAFDSISLSKLEREEQISYRILKRVLEEDQEQIQFRSHHLLLNQMSGVHLYVPLVIESMPNKTVEDYTNILSRLRQLPTLFTQVIELLNQGIEAGITPPRIAIRNVPQQIRNQMIDQPLESSLLKAFTQFPETINPELQSHLLEEAVRVYEQNVLPSFNQLHAYVEETYLPNCRTTTAFSDLPKGKEWYAYLVRYSTTTDLTPEEIHAIGLKEVERIHQEMMAIIESTGFNGNFKEFLHFLKTDRQFFFTSREEVLEGYRQLTQQIEAKLPLLFSQLPHLPFQVVPIPSYCEESQIAAYYCPGSIGDQRPGYFFINTSYPELRPKWEMEPLALHEAVPGHHLQITLAQELTNLPEFRKHSNFTAYIEGWGLYAESLGSELGLYQDPYSIFGRLNYEMLRAIRLVIDTGMHAMGWSREQAIDFFKKYVGMSDHEMITEVDRYLVIPGQALGYKIGELKIKELRRIATEELGSRFDIRDFHQAWLQHGTLPLDIVEDEILEWIQSSQHLLSEVEQKG